MKFLVKLRRYLVPNIVYLVMVMQDFNSKYSVWMPPKIDERRKATAECAAGLQFLKTLAIQAPEFVAAANDNESEPKLE